MMNVLDEVAFLARSENRVAVLRALAEQPQSRADLRSVTGASEATMARIVRDLTERRWIVREGSQYRATLLGDLVVSSFDPLTETIQHVSDLGVVGENLALSELKLDLETLVDARITRGTPGNPTAHVDRAGEILSGTGDLRLLASAAMDPLTRAVREGVEAGRLTADLTFTPPCADRLQSPSGLATHLAAVDEAGGTVRVTRRRFPSSLFFLDGLVTLWVCADGTPLALVETERSSVKEWAETTLDAYRCDARRLSAAELRE